MQAAKAFPSGEGGSRISRKRETDEGKKLSVKTCAYAHTLHKCFGSDPSGGNVLVPARTLIRSRLKGRCRKAAPLRIPRPLRRKRIKIYLVAMDGLFGSPQIDEGLCVMFFLNFTKERYCFLHGSGIIKRYEKEMEKEK